MEREPVNLADFRRRKENPLKTVREEMLPPELIDPMPEAEKLDAERRRKLFVRPVGKMIEVPDWRTPDNEEK